MHDISDILPEAEKSNLELKLGVRIETPGHERAAGLIIKSADPETNPITDETIASINEHINNAIAQLKEKEAGSEEKRVLTDMSALHLIDRINKAVRGNICNFERIAPLLKLTEDTIWTDSYTTEQYSMKDITEKKRFGYISINTDFHGGTVIVPVELVRRIVANGYKGYLSINYMDEGVFMAERALTEADAKRGNRFKGKTRRVWRLRRYLRRISKVAMKLNRDQIKDNPFYKYHDLGESDFNLFERMVIGLIDHHKIDMLAVFDVEANGFGNGKLMNFGAMNYSIDDGSGEIYDELDFNARLYRNQRGEMFLLNKSQIKELLPIPANEKHTLSLAQRRQLLLKPMDRVRGERAAENYYWHPSFDDSKAPGEKSKFKLLKNVLRDGKKVIINREIQARMIAYLVKDKDFKVPQEMTNLTGITQELLDKYGKSTDTVDSEVSSFYDGKKVLFGAHNTPYDSRILRANAPKIYQTLRDNGIYDSALFCKEEKLAYDEVKISSFKGIDGIPEGVFFYNSGCSDFNLSKFINQAGNGYYPDRSGQYLLSCEDKEFYFIDKQRHETVKLSATQEDLNNAVAVQAIPNIAVKYSVEKLSEQWMTHALLLSDEEFEISYVDLSQAKYAALKGCESELIFFQDNYLFDASPESNLVNFKHNYYAALSAGDLMDNDALEAFVADFLELNKRVHEKFSD